MKVSRACVCVWNEEKPCSVLNALDETVWFKCSAPPWHFRQISRTTPDLKTKEGAALTHGSPRFHPGCQLGSFTSLCTVRLNSGQTVFSRSTPPLPSLSLLRQTGRHGDFIPFFLNGGFFFEERLSLKSITSANAEGKMKPGRGMAAVHEDRGIARSRLTTATLYYTSGIKATLPLKHEERGSRFSTPAFRPYAPHSRILSLTAVS